MACTQHVRNLIVSFHRTIVQLRFQVTELILSPLKGVNVNLGPPLFVGGSERTLCLA